MRKPKNKRKYQPIEHEKVAKRVVEQAGEDETFLSFARSLAHNSNIYKYNI
jgi:hypothetical protein